jgi:opacity protein-like surface antigen
MRLKKGSTLAVLGVLACAFAAPAALAQPSHPRRMKPAPVPAFETTFGLVYTVYDEEVDLDDELGFAARFGYLFNPTNEIEFLFNFVSTDDTLFPQIDVDTFNFQTAYVHNFNARGAVPYLTAGLGFFTTEDQSLGSETDFVLGLGAGIRLLIGRAAFARFEYRYNMFEGDLPVYANGVDVSVNEFLFGFGWRIPLR